MKYILIMVFYKRKRNYKRKIYRRKKVYRKKTYKSSRGRRFPNAFPDSVLRYLNYQEETSVDAPGVGLDYKIYRCNDLYDPRDATGGHQPYGFDTWMSVYDHYTVIGSLIRVRNVVAGSSNVNPAYMIIHLSDSNAQPYTSIDHLLEAPDSPKLTVVGNVSGGQYNRPGYGNVISKSYSMKKFFKKRVGTTDMAGNAAANPTEGVYFNIYCASIAGTDPAGQDLLVTIDFIAIFTEPKVLSQS